MLANVLSWCGSRLGGSAPITARSTPPRRGVSAAWSAPNDAASVGAIINARMTAMSRVRRRPSPVTIDTSSGELFRVEKALACGRQPVEQRSRRPELVARLLLELEHAALERLEPDAVGPEHRPAPVDRSEERRVGRECGIRWW